MGISVRTSTLSPVTAYGNVINVDFSSDVGSGERVLAYSVALSYFRFQWATDSHNSFADVGQIGITLVPNLTGNTVSITANMVLTDYDGSGAAEPADAGNDGRESYVRVTVIAYIASSDNNAYAVLGTAYGVNGSTPAVPISPSGVPLTYAFISGFNATASSAAGMKSLNVSVSAGTASNNSVPLTGACSTVGDNGTTTGTVDVGVLSTPNTSFGVNLLSNLSWSKPDEENGMSCAFSTTFPLSAGQSIAHAGVILQKLFLTFDDPHSVEYLEAGVTTDPLTISGGTVSGSLILNLYKNGAWPDEYWIDKSSTLTAYVVAQLTTAS
jgi:hypothetical protein